MFLTANSKHALLPSSGSKATLYRYSSKDTRLNEDHIITYFPSINSLIKLTEYVQSNPVEFKQWEYLEKRNKHRNHARDESFILSKWTGKHYYSKDVYYNKIEMLTYLKGESIKTLSGDRNIKNEIDLIDSFQFDFNHRIQTGKRKIVRGIEGTEYDFTAKYIGRYDQTFRKVKKINQRGNKRIKNIHIIKNFGAAANQRHSLPIQSLIFTKLIDILETQGYSVKVSILCNIRRMKEYGLNTFLFPIKEYNERPITKKILIGNHSFTFISLILSACRATQYYDLEYGYNLSNKYLDYMGYLVDVELNNGRYFGITHSGDSVYAPHLNKVMDAIQRRETTILAPNIYDLGLTDWQLSSLTSDKVYEYLQSWLDNFKSKIEESVHA